MARRSAFARRTGVPPARRDLFLILLIVLAVDAAAAALLLLVYLPARRAEAFERARVQLARLARDRQNALGGWVRERRSDAELAATLIAGNPQRGPEIFDRFLRAYGYEAAVLVDREGIVRLRRGNTETDDATLVRFARETPARTHIDFRRTAKLQPKILTASGSTQGTIVFVSDPYQSVYPMFSTVSVEMTTGETNLIGIHDEEGLNLTPYPDGSPPPMTVRRPIPKASEIHALTRGERTISMIDRDGVPVIGIAKTIPETPWVTFAKMDVAEVVSTAVDEAVRLAQLSAVASVLLGITAFAILRSRRMQQLRAAEVQLERLYVNTTSGIVVVRVLVDARGAPYDHEVVDMNPAAEELFGVVASEEIGKRSADAKYLQWAPEIRARNYRVAMAGTSIEYERYDATTQRWYETRVFSPRHGELAHVLNDVTERKKSEEAVRHLSARLLRVQDETRRHIARGLHETVAQNLAALRMNLGLIQKRNDGEFVGESIQLVDDAVSEVRTMSYLLHPPMIDQTGLATTLRWYVDGFQQRSGIVTTLDVPEDLGRLPRDVETAVFRIIQESLTNVQRHSGSAVARVAVQSDGERLSVAIEDEGHGLPQRVRGDRDALLASGVGIAGINERVHELRGELDIRSSDRGTTLHVTLPVAAE